MLTNLRFRVGALVALAIPALTSADEETKLLPNDGANGDRFGEAVAISGSTTIVGASEDDDNGAESGSAYLFDTATGQQLAKLLPNDGANGDHFGGAVAIVGSTAIVGASWDDDNGAESGSAYLFDTATGQQLAKLLPSSGLAADFFGASVAIDGTVAIVGAPGNDACSSGFQCGSAYLFNVVTGQEIAKLLASDADAGDQFGSSVAIGGTTALIGTPQDDDNGAGSGSAYLFDTATGQQLTKLLPNDGASADRFGASVAMSGTLAIIGADGVGGSSGAAYLFDTTTGQQLAKLVPSGGSSAVDRFGMSVAVRGATAIVGALGDDDNGAESGSAYLFDTATGQQLAKLLPSDGAAGDVFGKSVAISGSMAIVSAIGWEGDTGTDLGAAYVFATWALSPVNGHWYRQLDRSTWNLAEVQAQAWGGHLATVRSQAENDWLHVTYKYTADLIWIGYTDQDAEGVFQWSSGEPVTYENWRPGEPDDFLDADWVVIRPDSGLWSDEPDLEPHVGIVEVVSDDCDADGLPDAYQIAQEPWLDWNGDGVLDECSSPNYCTAAANSTGVPAVIGVSGSPLIAANAFTLAAWDLPLHDFAYFLMSESTAFVPGFGGSSGNLCLGSPIVRLASYVLNSGSTGTVSLALDLYGLPQGIVLQPGDTWFFQLWYRDFTTGPTSNTTDGVEVMFR